MLEQKKSKVTIVFQNKKFLINASLVFTTRQITFILLLIVLAVLFVLVSIDEELKKYTLEMTMGILQSIVADYISHK